MSRSSATCSRWFFVYFIILIMFDKLKFNNLVISNKKRIQQARIHTINKLVSKIRKLKSTLEKRPEDEKNKERLRKSTMCMEHLKKLKHVEIMRKILLLESDPNAVITNGRATPEDVAIALLALNKVMQELIKEFRDVLQLNEVDLTWRESIEERSKRRARIERTEEKRHKRKVLKEQKAITRKRNEWLEQNQDRTGENNENSTTGAWQIDESDTKPAEIVAIKSNQPTPEPTNVKIRENKPMPRKEKVVKINSHVDHKPNNIIKLESKTLVQQSEEKEQNNTSKLVEKEITHVVDPFFVTDTGENYLSTAVINTELDEDFNQEEYGDNETAYLARKSKRNIIRNEHKNARQDLKFKNQKAGRFDNKRESFTNGNQSISLHKDKSAQDTNLHPSWLAKQKLKPIITNFAGKRIKFDDAENSNEIKTTSIETQLNKSSEQNNDEDKSLHPSWIAKQKLKPKIAAFQGKKITFSNDDED